MALEIEGQRTSSTMTWEGVRVTLQDVSYAVKDNRPKADRSKPLHLLQGITGHFEPGEMSALMGPSGSGKSTLLDVMAGRKTEGTMSGTLLFAGIKPTKEYLRRYTGYVEQFDTLLGILTVTEMLMYTSELKRPLKEPLSVKRQAVEETIMQLALDTCKNVKIGSPMERGISGGQAKRVNIAIALITNPRVLFLDEPTTGLDSFTANEVMVVVQRLAKAGVTVVATIHSPTSYAFSLFDSMMMLVGGRTVYFGPQGCAALTFFQESCPHIKAYEKGYNDAEYLVDLITEADRFGKGHEFADAYANSQIAATTRAEVEALVTRGQEQPLPAAMLKELQVSQSTVTPTWWGLWVFLKYRTSVNYRNPAFLGPRIFDKLLIGLLIMTLYLGIGDDFSQGNIINIAAILFMWSATTGFIASGYIPALVLERALYVRERADGLYLPITYLIARMLDELIINTFATACISAFVFYGIDLQGSYVCFWMAFYVAVCTGIILAYLVASISPNMDVANALLPIYAITLMFFAGFLVRFDNMPPWWKWYSYIDFGRYAWSAMMINQFENNDVEYINGMTVLQFYGLDGVKDKWACIGYNALFFIFYFVCTALVLTFKKYASR